jgi:hypothetical protein
MALGCDEPVTAGLAVGTVAGFTLYAQICAEHAGMIAEMRDRLPASLRDWSGTLEPIPSDPPA